MITNIRVILLDQFVFGSDDRSQYYSVGEWVVRGTCSCSGHASVCAPAPGETLTSDKVIYQPYFTPHFSLFPNFEQYLEIH